MKHCISCGKKGVRWPRHEPEACSARCAASAGLAYAEGGLFEAAYCPECGHPQLSGGRRKDHYTDCPEHPDSDPDAGEDS